MKIEILTFSLVLFFTFSLKRRGAGVAELAALEMLCMGNYTVGSNPTLSATEFEGKRQNVDCFLCFLS